MTTYTTPNSLPILETSDKIAAAGDGLRLDINALALATSTAISAEGVRAEGSAKSYADGKDTTNRSAWASADANNLTSAKSYADTQDVTNLTSAKSYADTQDTAKLTAAKTYADDQDAAYRLVDRALWRSEDEGHQTAAEANAKTYADGTFIPAWKPLTVYTAGQRVIAPNGDTVAAKVNFTSGATYNAANWNASPQDARIALLESKAGLTDLVTNGSFRNGLTGWTNTGAWVAQTNGITSWARTMSGGDGAFAQQITVPAAWLGKTLRLKVLAMTTSAGTLLTSVVTTAGTTSLNHTLTTAYVERTLDVVIPAGQGTTPITLNSGRFSGTVYMTSIRLEAL